MTRAFRITRTLSDTWNKSGTALLLMSCDIVGPRNATIPPPSAKGAAFRMYDDDGNLCATGRFYGDPSSEDAFAPLDCYGEGALGCTRIDYRQPDGTWATL